MFIVVLICISLHISGIHVKRILHRLFSPWQAPHPRWSSEAGSTSYALIPPAPTVINKAMDLLLTYPLRRYDAVQLASALTLPPPPHGVRVTFVSADEGLLTVTKKLGLSVENPNLHP